MKCKERGCKKDGAGWVSKNIYCTDHYNKKRESDKTQRNSNGKVKRFICIFNGCDRILGYSSKYRLCSVHKQIEMMRIMLIERKMALTIALRQENG